MSEKFDILFVGSGSSSTFSLLNLIDNVLAKELCANICVVEQSDYFFTGIAYGSRSGENALTITKLMDFLPEAERLRYLRWVDENRNELENPNLVSQFRALETAHADDLQDSGLRADSLENICICRRSFGNYLVWRIENAVRLAESKGLLRFDRVNAEVTDIFPDGEGGFTCVAENAPGKSFELRSSRVVLGIGGAPVRELKSEVQSGIAPSNRVINLYDQDFDSSFKAMLSRLDTSSDAGSSVLIVGANASALEVLFRLRLQHQNKALAFKIQLISTLGELPSLSTSAETDAALAQDTQTSILFADMTAEQLSNWSETTIKEARHRGLPLSSYTALVNERIFLVLDVMEKNQALVFLRKYANALGRFQRKAENPYLSSSQELIDAGILTVNAGLVSVLSIDESGVLVSVTNQGVTTHQKYNIVINCMGSEPVDSSSRTVLIQKILGRQLAESASGQQGFVIDDSFRTSGGLYVIGPMMSGNYVQERPVWHMEHMGRIIQFSQLLADELAKDLTN